MQEGPKPHQYSSREQQSWRTIVDAFKSTASHEHKRGVYLHGVEGTQEFRTYAQLLEGALRVGAALEKKGIKQGDELLLCMPTGYDFITSFFGATFIGAVPIPLAPPRRDSRQSLGVISLIERLAERLGVALLLFNDALPVEQRPVAGPGTVFAKTLSLARILDDVPLGATAWPRHSLPESAYIQLSSGATGPTKGIRLSHANILSSVQAVGQAVQVTPDDIGLCWLPLDNIMGMVGFLCFSIYWGLDLVLMDPVRFLDRPVDWLWAIHQHGATVTAAPDFAYYHCLRRVNTHSLEGLDLSSLRVAMSGAEPVRARHIKMFLRRFESCGLQPQCFMPVYGLSEGTLALTFCAPNEPLQLDCINRRVLEHHNRIERFEDNDRLSAYERMHLVSVGKPLSGITVSILDEDNQPMPPDSLGRIATRGPHVMQGYVPDSWPSSFRDGWLVTDDLGYLNEAGYLFVIEREPDTLDSIWGRRIFPSEVELFINAVDGVRAGTALVFLVQEDDQERVVVAYETQTGAALDEIQDEVRRLLKKHLDLDVDTIVELSTSSVPKSRDGKTRRFMARALFEQGLLDRKDRTTELDGVMRLVNRARSDVVRLAHVVKNRAERMLARTKKPTKKK